jgi:hypothetical protein
VSGARVVRRLLHHHGTTDMIGDIIEIERAKRTTFETLEISSLSPRVSGDSAVLVSASDAPQSTFVALMASVREKLGRFKIRLD